MSVVQYRKLIHCDLLYLQAIQGEEGKKIVHYESYKWEPKASLGSVKRCVLCALMQLWMVCSMAHLLL